MCDVVVCRCFDGAEQNYGFGCRFRQDGNDCYWCYSFGKGGFLNKESLLDLMVIIRLPMFPVTLSCFIAILV